MGDGFSLASEQCRQLLADVHGDGSHHHGWVNYKPFILAVARQMASPSMLEVGGGRTPLLSEKEIASLSARYTVNDIDEAELLRSPGWVHALHGDISDPALVGGAVQPGEYNLIFSRMVFEHISDPKPAYENLWRLLSPGGIMVNFVPTLYAAPFVVNRLLPERLSARLLQTFFPNRTQAHKPKFPAYYRWTTATPRTRKRVESVGFDKIEIVPFYGHGYYEKLGALEWLARKHWRLANRRDLRAFSSYALILGEKAAEGPPN